MTVEELIQKAKESYPCNFEFKGKIKEEDFEKIKEVCDVKTFSVSMSGNHVYHIRYRKE